MLAVITAPGYSGCCKTLFYVWRRCFMIQDFDTIIDGMDSLRQEGKGKQ